MMDTSVRILVVGLCALLGVVSIPLGASIGALLVWQLREVTP